MKKLTKKELKKHLNNKTKDELVEEIWLLTKKYDFVKQHYEEEINYSEITKLLNKYKKMVTDLFSEVNKGEIPKIKEVFNVIEDYKGLVGQHESITDLFLHTLAQNVNYAKTFGEVNETVSQHLEKVLTDTLTSMVKQQTYGKYKEEFDHVVEELSTYKTGLGSIISKFIPSINSTNTRKTYKK